MNHKDLSTESAAGTIATQTESRHYSFRHQHRHLWHCAWVWILIFCFLTPQFSYNAEADFWESVCEAWDDAWNGVTNVGEELFEHVIEPVAHALIPKELRDFLWNDSVKPKITIRIGISNDGHWKKNWI